MRPVARILASLLVLALSTTALGLSGYSLLLAWQREPLPGEAQPPAPAALSVPAAPDQVAFTDFAPPAMRPLMTAPPVAPLQIPVRLRTAASPAPDAGIAAFQRERGADFQWLPASAGRRDGDDLVFTVPAFDRGPVVLTYAPSRAAARHGYFARAETAMGNGTTAEVVLDGRTPAVTLQLPPGLDRAGPIRLARRDDPTWLPMAPELAAFTLTQNQPLQVPLGPGDYEVYCPLQPAHRQSFTVPATQNLILLCAPAEARAARQ